MINVLPVIFLVASLSPTTTMARISDLSTSINEFSVDLYKSIIDGKKDNFIMSPLSAQTVLALVYQGAGGNTASQLSTGLHLSQTKEQSQDDFQSFLTRLNYQTGVTLEIANKVYVMDNYVLKPTFKEVAVTKFLSETENLNFAESAKSAATMNQWVEQKTHDKIKDLVSADSLNGDTRMVLINAIYFKGYWAKQFDPALTLNEPFYTTETDSVEVPMMHLNSKFRYADLPELNAKVIELPYKDSDLAMLIILPNSRTGLSELEANLQTVNLKNLTEKMRSVDVHLALPKFKIESTIQLVDHLKKLGMTDMFSPIADFSGLLDSPEPLYCSEVIQKAFIEVNEEGAEAAAATAVLVQNKSARVILNQDEFHADKPFMFILFDKITNSKLFVGHLLNNL